MELKENLINFSKEIGETDVIIGIGGGKGIDLAKGISFYSKLATQLNQRQFSHSTPQQPPPNHTS